jgi:cytochrome b561
LIIVLWTGLGGDVEADEPRTFARAVHVAFYALLFALPVSGWLLASAEGARHQLQRRLTR